MRKLVLIDGNSLLHRAYHAYPMLTTPKGEVVGAVYGFTSMLLNVLEKLAPTHVAVAWDVKGPTFRKLEYEDYKANRGPMDDELVSQIERTHEVVEVMNIPHFGIEGYEGDDIIGTLSQLATDEKTEEDVQVVIVTGDKDSLQLVKEKKVVVYLPIQNKYSSTNSVFDEDMVEKTFGLKPYQIIELKGLMGDASDNIPGIKGIGKVTATKLLTQYETIEGIYKHIEEIKGKVKELLVSGEEDAIKSRKLATIDTKVPLKIDWENCRLTNYDKQKVLDLFNELNFKSLINKLPADEWEKEAEDIFI